jgi:malate permease and related proteins
LANVILLGACFLFGIVLRRLGRMPDNASATFSGFVVHVSLPALTLLHVHDLKFNSTRILPVMMA